MCLFFILFHSYSSKSVGENIYNAPVVLGNEKKALKNLKIIRESLIQTDQALVVQRLDNAIYRINHYPVDSVV